MAQSDIFLRKLYIVSCRFYTFSPISIRKGRVRGGGGKGHLAVYYISFQSSIITFPYSLALQLWGLVWNFYWSCLFRSQSAIAAYNYPSNFIIMIYFHSPK